MALGKETFADGFFADCSLPSAALGKAFTKCISGFAECQALGKLPVSRSDSSNVLLSYGIALFERTKERF